MVDWHGATHLHQPAIAGTKVGNSGSSPGGGGDCDDEERKTKRNRLLARAALLGMGLSMPPTTSPLPSLQPKTGASLRPDFVFLTN